MCDSVSLLFSGLKNGMQLLISIEILKHIKLLWHIFEECKEKKRSGFSAVPFKPSTPTLKQKTKKIIAEKTQMVCIRKDAKTHVKY